MKKLMLTALLAVGAMTVNAESLGIYAYQPGEGDKQLSSEFYVWDGSCSNEEVTDAEFGKAMKVTDIGGTWFGLGYVVKDNTLDFTRIKDCNSELVFNVKSTDNYTAKIKMENSDTGIGLEPVFDFPRDGQWHEVRMDLHRMFGTVIGSFTPTTTKGNYLFAFVGNNTADGMVAYYTNVRIELNGEYESPYKYGNAYYGTIDKQVSGKNVEIAYEFIANENGTLTVNATFAGAEEIPGIVYQFHTGKTVGGWPSFTKNGEVYTLTTAETFTPGEQLNDTFFWLPYEGGVERVDVNYVFGDANDKPVTAIRPRLNASAQNVTAHSAEIVYEVKLPSELEGAEVKVFNGETELGASPALISDLDQNTDYRLTIKAVATLGGESYESKPVEVAFKTLRDGAKEMVYYAIADDVVPNAYLVGEDPSARRDIPMSIEAVITYNPDKTMTVVATPHCAGEIVGLVPGITLRGKFDRKDMAVVDGKWTVTTPADVTYEEGEDFDYLYFWLRYAGGESGNRFFVRGYKAGDENEPLTYGEVAALDLSVAADVFAQEQSAPISAIAKDAAGHYIFDSAAEYALSNDCFVLEGNKVKASALGKCTLTATAGTATASKELVCIYSSNAQKLTGTATSSNPDHNTELVFDGNEGTQIEWSCAEGQVHSLDINLGKNYRVQGIELVWEGASATAYTVALSAEISAVEAAYRAPVRQHVFEVTDGQGGAGVTARKVLYRDDLTPVDAQYIRLETSKAFDAGWGIKLKEMKITGTDDSTITGVASVEAADDATPEYYNLQGLRVLNPAAGVLYIVRRGNNVTKEYIR